LGLSLRRDGKFFFFGSRHLGRADLPVVFPRYEFCFLQQVHGRDVVIADPRNTLTADAHFTNSRGLAVVAQSADCVPILLSCAQRVCAIHAGWRGLAQNIIGASQSHCSQVTFAAIGPHIHASSFEVGTDVAQSLQDAAPPATPRLSAAESAGKCLFDLNALARAQLQHTFGRSLAIGDCARDTKSDLEFYSFRREREKCERQYSFIVIED